MKKLLLVPTFVVMSSSFALAGGWFGGTPTTSSTVGVHQNIFGTNNSLAVNNAKVGQLALGIGDANVHAKTNVSQNIGFVNNSIAVNNAQVSNAAVGINP